MHDVLGLSAPMDHVASGPWHPFACFAPDGLCVANVDAAILPLVVDGQTCNAGGIRSVAVDPAWRGRGLFRRLMAEALGWRDAGPPGPTLLYTEEPAIYRAFGFREMPQHAFLGRAPAPSPGRPTRRLSLDAPPDLDLLLKAIARRTPVSTGCALFVDAPLIVASIAADADIRLAYAAAHDAVILYEIEGDLLTLVDIVAPVIPDLAQILGALGIAPRYVKTLFLPDRLNWSGAPIAEDTGLMMRGAAPAAMTRPFMFPPTAEF